MKRTFEAKLLIRVVLSARSAARIELNPLVILFDVDLRLPNPESLTEPRICRQKLPHCRLIARRYAPLSILTQQILLDDNLSFRLNRSDDSSIKNGIDDRQIAHHFGCADVHSIELIKILCPLQCTYKT